MTRRTLLTLCFIGYFGYANTVQAGLTLVKLKNSSSAALTLESSDTRGWKYLPAVDLYLVAEEGKEQLHALHREGVIERSEKETDIQLEVLPDDPFLNKQGWVTSEDLDIGAGSAWDMTIGSSDITVAVIDTGNAMDHPDLRDNLWTNPNEIPNNGKDDDRNGLVDDVHGYDFWNQNAEVIDEYGHGTHMAGVIGAVGDNGFGVSGVNWRVSLMPLRFTGADGSGSSALAVEAIDYAIQNGAQVINASWTLKSIKGQDDALDLVHQAIQKAGEAGILFVTASGNQFQTFRGNDLDQGPVYPASFNLNNILTVAAVDQKGALASYSNYGEETVDVAAPGSNITSTGTKNDYTIMTGTSVATAVVSGAAALILSERPELKPAQLSSLIMNTVTKEDTLIDRIKSGGMINIHAAMTLGGEYKNSIEATQNQSASQVGGCSLVY